MDNTDELLYPFATKELYNLVNNDDNTSKTFIHNIDGVNVIFNKYLIDLNGYSYSVISAIEMTDTILDVTNKNKITKMYDYERLTDNKQESRVCCYINNRNQLLIVNARYKYNIMSLIDNNKVTREIADIVDLKNAIQYVYPDEASKYISKCIEYFIIEIAKRKILDVDFYNKYYTPSMKNISDTIDGTGNHSVITGNTISSYILNMIIASECKYSDTITDLSCLLYQHENDKEMLDFSDFKSVVRCITTSTLETRVNALNAIGIPVNTITNDTLLLNMFVSNNYEESIRLYIKHLFPNIEFDDVNVSIESVAIRYLNKLLSYIDLYNVALKGLRTTRYSHSEISSCEVYLINIILHVIGNELLYIASDNNRYNNVRKSYEYLITEHDGFISNVINNINTMSKYQYTTTLTYHIDPNEENHAYDSEPSFLAFGSLLPNTIIEHKITDDEGTARIISHKIYNSDIDVMFNKKILYTLHRAK